MDLVNSVDVRLKSTGDFESSQMAQILTTMGMICRHLNLQMKRVQFWFTAALEWVEQAPTSRCTSSGWTTTTPRWRCMLSIKETKFLIFNSNFHFVWLDNNNSMVDKLSIKGTKFIYYLNSLFGAD